LPKLKQPRPDSANNQAVDVDDSTHSSEPVGLQMPPEKSLGMESSVHFKKRLHEHALPNQSFEISESPDLDSSQATISSEFCTSFESESSQEMVKGHGFEGKGGKIGEREKNINHAHKGLTCERSN
jgi:hypothetical protein